MPVSCDAEEHHNHGGHAEACHPDSAAPCLAESRAEDACEDGDYAEQEYNGAPPHAEEVMEVDIGFFHKDACFIFAQSGGAEKHYGECYE